jgi:hypothetical protein
MSHRDLPSAGLMVCLFVVAMSVVGGALGYGAETPEEPPMTSEREVIALRFAREHHPELAQLLDQLKTKNSRQYTAAIRDLYKSADRIERLRTRHPERYEAELLIWQLDSQIRLLAARLASSADSGLDAELRELIARRQALLLKQLEEDRAKVMTRLDRLNESIDELRSHGDALVEREFDRLKENARARNGQPRGSSSPAGTAPKAKSPPTEKPSATTENR